MLVTAVTLLPSFAFGEGRDAPFAPKCTEDPPGLVDPPPLSKALEVATPIQSSSANVGVLPGAGGVTPTGEYTYRIPIDVPAGRAGMQPSLALSYSSRGGNGYLGVGWHLEGLSEITACPKTIGTEEVADGVYLNQDDALCLDGQKLIRIGPYTAKTDGCAGDEYRTEEDIFARIVSCKPNGADQPTRFTAWAKDGRIRRYDAIEARELNQRRPLIGWPIAEESDRAGNSVHYTYARTEPDEAVEYYPSSIEYTQSAGSQEPARRSVKFLYQERGDKMRSAQGFESSVSLTRVERRITQRLYGIEVYAPRIDDVKTAELAWKYDLTYQPDPAPDPNPNAEPNHTLRRSRLAQVRKCGAFGGCLLRKKFTWESHAGPEYVETTSPLTTEEAQSYWEFATTLSPWGDDQVPLIVADLDGDGRDDVVLGRPYHPDISVRTTVDPALPLGERRSIALPTLTDPFWGYSRIADIDGNGRDDIVVPERAWNGGTRYWILYSNGSLSDTSPSLVANLLPQHDWDFINRGPTLFLADLNGDGLTDIVSDDPVLAAGGWSYRLNHGGLAFGPAVGSGLTGPQNLLTPVAMDTGHRRATIFTNQSVSPSAATLEGFRLSAQNGAVEHEVMDIEVDKDGERRVQADVDGDGYRDDLRLLPTIEWIEPTVYDTLRTVKHRAKLSWRAPAHPGSWSGSRSVTEATIEVSQSTGVPPDSVDAPKWEIKIADLDGDGREEVVVTYTWREPTVDPWVLPVTRVFAFSLDTHERLFQRELPITKPIAMGDFDGDGLLDILSIPESHGPTTFHMYRQVGLGNIDRIVAVADEGDSDDPEHAREKVVYSTSWSPDPSTAQCQHPQRCMKHGFAVVREHDVYAGQDAVSYASAPYLRTLYNYEDPRFNVHGQGFLGFGVVRSWEVERSAETTTTYDHDSPGFGGNPLALRPKHVLRAIPGTNGGTRVSRWRTSNTRSDPSTTTGITPSSPRAGLRGSGRRRSKWIRASR